MIPNSKPPWIIPNPYRTRPLDPLPILPPLKRVPMPIYPHMKKMNAVTKESDGTKNG